MGPDLSARVCRSCLMPAAHSGGFYGCSTYLVLELDYDLAVIVLTNGEPFISGTWGQKRAFQKIIDRLFREARRMAGID